MKDFDQSVPGDLNFHLNQLPVLRNMITHDKIFNNHARDVEFSPEWRWRPKLSFKITFPF